MDESNLKIPHMESVRRAAEITGTPVHFIYQKVKAGEIVAVKAGRKYLVNVDKLIEYLNTATITQTAENAHGERLQRIAPIPHK